MAWQWDYLIVTASNRAQAASYERQLRVRRGLGFLHGVREVMVVPDPPGRRIGSGGSTLLCLAQVLRRAARGDPLGPDPSAWRDLLAPLRVLIVHAGGDSRRLPAYGPCGKLFVPLPGESDAVIPLTLFDRQMPTYLALPPCGVPGRDGAVAAALGRRGQVVVTAGDVLLNFDPNEVWFADRGMTGLGVLADPARAAKHGVYCAPVGAGGARAAPVRLYLQKPSPDQQARLGAVDRYGQSVLDIGVLSFDAETAAALLAACGVWPDSTGRLEWRGEVGRAIDTLGLDIYREVCCALGRDATPEHHLATARASGSKWEAPLLGRLFAEVSKVPFSVQALPQCDFLHFGTTRQVISSGAELIRLDEGASTVDPLLSINNEVDGGSAVAAGDAWLEGCRVRAALELGGRNVVVGVDVDAPLSVPPGGCLDVLQGRDREGSRVHFVRWYAVDDTFKDGGPAGSYAGRPLERWLERVGAAPGDVWPADVAAAERSVWNARLFPAAGTAGESARYRWVLDPDAAPPADVRAWLAADRYSCAEIADLADHGAFHARREGIRARRIAQTVRRCFRSTGRTSAAELAYVLRRPDLRVGLVAEVLAEARRNYAEGGGGQESFAFCRILHTLASAVDRLAAAPEGDASDALAGPDLLNRARPTAPAPDELRGARPLGELLPGLADAVAKVGAADLAWLEDLGLGFDPAAPVADWTARVRARALAHLGRTIISATGPLKRPEDLRQALRTDEIVWGRAPARLDLGGGWTDTPPYTLEQGGCVINAAVDLNGQPPIQCYARVIADPVIRISSIDLGTRIEVRTLADLLDYRSPRSEFALAKAALALAGFSPEVADWPPGTDLPEMLRRFGGGIELTTLAAVPKGSGLGTSSIVGAVLLSVIWRVMGRHAVTQQELFNGVLRLEQALTTGGGWQDQIGGAVEGAKVITTAPGLVPDATIHYQRADVLDPAANGGCTLLYYTGLTRLARNILQNVVGRYLDRDRDAVVTLERLRALPPRVADAMARKDLAAFGRLIDYAWSLNKELDPASSTPTIEAMLRSIGRYVYGAKLLGAGGGGFLLIVCKSPRDAATVRWELQDSPPNERARFFDFGISRTGMAVTVC